MSRIALERNLESSKSVRRFEVMLEAKVEGGSKKYNPKKYIHNEP